MKKRFKWFTLIELVIVTAILWVLMVMMVVKVKQWISRAQDAKRKKDITDYMYALNFNYIDTKTYPAHVPTSGGWGRETSKSPTFMSSLLGKYLKSTPADPVNFYDNAFPRATWNLLTHNYSIYVYGNYTSWYVWTVSGSAFNCNLSSYAVIAASNMEVTPPGMRPSCPWYDWTTIVDYGFVLYNGGTYAQYVQNVWGSVLGAGTWSTGGTSTAPLSTQCGGDMPGNGASPAVGTSSSCYCDNGDIDVNDDNVRGTSEYTFNSKVCNAAVHAWVLSPPNGNIRWLITPWRTNYIGTRQNGVTSQNRNNAPKSFRVYSYP
jgi:type II secretory pathway pseudopilin PulG